MRDNCQPKQGARCSMGKDPGPKYGSRHPIDCSQGVIADVGDEQVTCRRVERDALGDVDRSSGSNNCGRGWCGRGGCVGDGVDRVVGVVAHVELAVHRVVGQALRARGVGCRDGQDITRRIVTKPIGYLYMGRVNRLAIGRSGGRVRC
jgi:hypothetical protein